MGIVKENDNTYRVSFHKREPVTRKPISFKRKGIKTKSQAEKIFRELVILAEKTIEAKKVPTWDKLLDEYEKFLPETGVQGKTIYNRLSILRFNTFASWKFKLVSEINTGDIHELLQTSFLSKAESHKKHFVSSLRSVFEYAIGKSYMVRNPTPKLNFKISSKIKNCLTESQILTLLKKSQEFDWDWYPHYAVAVYTGLRNGELYALEWSNVDLDNRKILVNCSWNSKDGFKSTKSGDDRVVEIPNPLLPVLQELKLKSGGSHFVLPRLSKWDKGEQARELRFLLKSIGLPAIRFHDLRASWATWLLSKGVVPSKVMSMGGWKDMDTMMIYMRKAGIDIQGSTNVLDDIQTHGVLDAKIIEFQRM